MIKPKLIILDMDGLMIDSEALFFNGLQKSLARHGLELEDGEVDQIVGFSDASNISVLRKKFPGKNIDAIFNEYVPEHHARTTSGKSGAKPGLFELFEFCETNGIEKAVATTSFTDYAIKVLKSENIWHRLSGGVFGDMVERNKPAPDIYIQCMRQMRCEREQCLVLEDSAAGITAAVDAGISVVAVPDVVRIPPHLLSRCLTVCKNLREVITLIDVSIKN